MADKFILALDEGTTGAAAFVFNDEGDVVAVGDREFTQHFPKPGWVEHDAEEIWQTQLAVAKYALAKADLRWQDLAGIGVTNQRETAVAWDARTGNALAPAIVWQDRRTAARCDDLNETGWAPRVRRKTGLVIDAYFSATKFEWMLQHVPAVKRAANSGHLRFGTVDSWLIHRLSGGDAHVTDASNASRTLLFDITKNRWDDDLLDEFGVTDGMLPEVVASSGVVAHTSQDVVGASVPVAGIAGDQQAALFGQACVKPGQAKNTYGTGSFLLMNTGKERPKSKRLLSTVAWRIKDQTEYALEGSIFTTGASVQWLRDQLGVIKTAEESETVAESVPDSGGVYFVPALQGLGAPWWDQYARGAFIGLTRGTTPAHLVRAVLEATAYRVVDVARAMEEDSGVKLRKLRVDGGGAMNRFMMQFQSNVLGVPVERPRISETTALGAALLAGLGVGVYASKTEIAKRWRVQEAFTPTMKKGEREARYERWLDVLSRAEAFAEE